ncbi:MAG: hypothetical protein ACRDD1_18620, partial [Planctomycetia bacterium]
MARSSRFAFHGVGLVAAALAFGPAAAQAQSQRLPIPGRSKPVGPARPAPRPRAVDPASIVYDDGFLQGRALDKGLHAYYTLDDKLIGIGPDPSGRTRLRSLDVHRLSEKLQDKVEAFAEAMPELPAPPPWRPGLPPDVERLRAAAADLVVATEGDAWRLGSALGHLQATRTAYAEVVGNVREAGAVLPLEPAA